MTIHIVKLCVGADNVEDLAEWQIGQIKRAKKEKRPHIAPVCGTRMWPKRVDDVLRGGSLYWVIKGVILCRHKIVRLDEVIGADGIARCGIVMDPEVVRTEAASRRPFQGWRYLDAKDAPPDLPQGRAGDDRLPEDMALALAEIGLR